MADDARQIVLGSRSPRRLIVPESQITVVPPRNAAEPGFADARDWDAVEARLVGIAEAKCEDVLSQVDAAEISAVITADTVIVVEEPDGQLVVLGQPPDDERWEAVVKNWFRRYLLGTFHTAATAVCVAVPGGPSTLRVVKTRVRFGEQAERWVDWYLRTGEPRGKAGGYAIQGAGGMFVSEVSGSLSNVVGLPVAEVVEILEEHGVVEC